MRMMLGLSVAVVSGAIAATAADVAGGTSRTIIPRVADFTFTQRWVNPTLCGKRFWYSVYTHPRHFQTCDVERYAWIAGSEEELIQISRALSNGQSVLGDDPLRHRRLALFRDGKIPLTHICMRSKTAWDEQRQVLLWEKMPAPEEIRALASRPDFVGWSVSSEWGHDLLRMLEDVETATFRGGRLGANWPEVAPLFYKALIPKPPSTRREFAEIAARVWRAIHEPFEYQGEGHDGSHYWALQWPALLGARSIITENRYGGRSTTLFQAFTRAAGRMGNIPWGYAPGATFDVSWGVGPYRSTVARFVDQLARGWCPFSHNCWRRLLYYWCMGDAAIIRDEQTHRFVSDPENDGTWRLTRYGHVVEEVMDFSERCPDRGTPYTPIGVLLAWDNGFGGAAGRSLKAFDTFPYDDGEHMTRELFNRVLYPTDETWGTDMDLFGASPYGDIYDPLRIDTPRGPLPLELLRNYTVLLAVGRQNMDEALAARLGEYVTQGGVLILNVKQLEGGFFGRNVLGVEHSGEPRRAAGMRCELDGRKLDTGTFTYTPLRLGEQAEALYTAPNGDVLAARHPYGQGLLITVGAHWMLEDERTHPTPTDTRAQMLPMAGDLIGRLLQAALPFAVRGEHVAERVLYQVSRKGRGWMISLYNNSGRQTSFGRAPERVQPDHRVDVEITVPPEMTHAVEWLSRDRLGIVRGEGEHTGLLRIGLEPGDVRIVEIQPGGIPPAEVIERVNLALNRPVKASSFCEATAFTTDHSPELAVNGNRDIYDAWWSRQHADAKTPQWLEVDLGEVKTISSVNTIFMWSEDSNLLQRVYQYTVERSTDGATWEMLLDESTNMSPAHPRGHHAYFAPVSARFVRVTTTLNTAISGAQIVELEVYGEQKAPRVYTWGKTAPLRTTVGRREFPAALGQARKAVHLSDIKPASWEQKYMQPVFDKEVLKGGPIRIGSQEFAKGLGVHAPSQVFYDLTAIPGRWRHFAASVGIDAGSTPEGTVDFVVSLDGVEQVRTGCTRLADAPFPVWIPLGNAKVLGLAVEDCGDGAMGDIADWAEARLVE